MIILTAASGLHVDGGTGLPSDGRIVGVGLHTEFLQRIHGRNERNVAAVLCIGHAVKLKIVGVDVVAPAIGGEL